MASCILILIVFMLCVWLSVPNHRTDLIPVNQLNSVSAKKGFLPLNRPILPGDLIRLLLCRNQPDHVPVDSVKEPGGQYNKTGNHNPKPDDSKAKQGIHVDSKGDFWRCCVHSDGYHGSDAMQTLFQAPSKSHEFQRAIITQSQEPRKNEIILRKSIDGFRTSAMIPA